MGHPRTREGRTELVGMQKKSKLARGSVNQKESINSSEGVDPRTGQNTEKKVMTSEGRNNLEGTHLLNYVDRTSQTERKR